MAEPKRHMDVPPGACFGKVIIANSQAHLHQSQPEQTGQSGSLASFISRHCISQASRINNRPTKEPPPRKSP